ncbi:MAG: DNA methyltransferase [Sphingopyxis sp.]|uniref:MT-A70 family methyltransferase n=1 Tax=Sphingopyxis sp. TaxID=1908224 RepID=UPI001A5D9FA3|nr:MT-A70 family methyltransferase [Sphingopyxis sp.]MBL9070438.1 DNA methyltransferase [Sphingopyxis sp.]
MSEGWPFGTLMPFRYGAIYADPPWRMKMYSEKGMGRCPDGPMTRAQSRTNNPARHYETMSIDDIRALPVNHLAAEDCVLFMWAIDPLLPEAIEIGRHWGFEYKTVAFYWAKMRRETSNRAKDMDDPMHKLFPMGTGYWTRANPELCLLFTRGNPKRLSASVRKLVTEPRREHSRKPDRIRSDIEALCDGPYCELFARSPAPSWESWGNETTKFDAEAA